MAEAADFQGMVPSPARRWLRRTAGLLAGAPLVAGLLYLPAAAPAQAAEDATGSRTVEVSLDAMSPGAPVEGDEVTVSGTVTNRGKEAITDAHVGIGVGPRLSGRAAIDAVDRRSQEADARAPAELGGKFTKKFAKLPAGISEDFSITVPVDKLDLDDQGVYQLGVSLSGQTQSRPYEQTLGIQKTFLPWQPDATEKKTQLTYLWPLISSTHVTAETGSDEQQTPVFENDNLGAELAPGGRLNQLVSLGNELPVTWVVDPDLLATVNAMTESYQVKPQDGETTVPGQYQAVANRWLSDLQKAVSGRKVVALPFADPDLASLAHRGKDVPGSLSHLRRATDVAATAVKSILHTEPSTDFAWPVHGAVDPSVVDVATSAGAHNVIARSDSLHETGGLPYTPTATRPIGGGTNAVVADARLSTAFEGDMSKAGNSTLAVQKFLAQTLAVTLQDEEKQRSVVVAPQRLPSASQAQSMASALHSLDAQRWSQPLDLVAAAKAKPDARATTDVPGPASYPRSLSRQELPAKAFQDIKATQDKLDNFKVILTSPDRVVTPFGNAINRAMSTSWRGSEPKAQEYRDGVQSYLVSLTDEVQLIQKSDATLSGRSATVPVTVQNQLVQGVEHLVLRLESTKPTRLKLDGDQSVAEGQVKIAGGHSQSVKFTATANANGPVPVTAQLYTEDGTPYGRQMEFTVDVNEFTPTVMLVIAGGVLLLVLAGIRMYTQRKRAAAREEADGDGDGDGGDDGDTDGGADGGDDSEQPSDPTPDTGPESGAPSGAGEKVDR
ncbi:hypothetical protein J7E96_18800 [Streptomyces sp. ISL-96]|uniref:DUF6049 family protein n=1 Tax=Streptomyces sp. ISL-96 TaxID=2819191 RepID=UPI001BE77E8B|nr:DUF6049 family protein [Streptomyces sp. ISL-96]MBT2490527.1 hypothetical protein [Streptomyces sp. ISL-96]